MRRPFGPRRLPAAALRLGALRLGALRLGALGFLGALGGMGGLASCSRAEPPTPDASPFVAHAAASSLEPSGATPPIVFSDAGTPGKASARALGAATAASLGSSGSPGSSALLARGSTTPEDASAVSGQTQDMPSADAASFRAHAALLWRAIADDNPDAAMAFFFPLPAYQQVKDVGDPAADWNRRLVSAFRQDIHALHAKLGDEAASATFVSLDVPSARARWVLPGEEWNKIGYYRVFGSKLRYEAGGQSRSFDVKSLISWRGEWFVVHLTAVR